MAYNLQPLITILQQILNPQQTRWILDHNKPHLESLLEKAASLQHILEKNPLVKTETLEGQIRDAAHKAEDFIECRMVYHLVSIPRDVSFTFITPDLQQVTQELDSVMEQVVKLMEGNTTTSGTSWSGVSFSSSKSVVVGVDEDLLQLKDRLTGMQRKLEIVPIVGMGGVGKTTLARKLYEDELIVSCFEYRGWTTISQDYNVKAILLGLLHCIIGKEADQHMGKETNELKDVMYRCLFGRKYIIVLDDIWSTSFWDEIQRYFPNNNNGSRILITTRESNVAKYIDSRSLQHQVQLLSKSQSWNLLHQIVFGDEDCPHSLQGIGDKIASDCGGLPLAISVIGGLLSKVERSEGVWENIGNDVRAAIAESDDEQFSDILSLSYNHLPNHLKPCFLYMGAFPEDHVIKASKLIYLWVAEGFVKSNGDKSLEEEAWDYLKALVERNLLIVKEKNYNGKPKTYNIHDLLRDLCIRKAEEEKFLRVKNSHNATIYLVEEDKSNEETEILGICDLLGKYLCMREADEDVKKATFSTLRRVSVHPSYLMKDVYALPALMPFTRSFLCTSKEIRSSFLSELRLLRVLDVYDAIFFRFPTPILLLVNLRYLAIRTDIPSDISRLWTLQTLIAYGGEYVPFEIWELPELRHLKVFGMMRFKRELMKRISVEKKLQTTSMITLSDELIEIGFFESISDITSLKLYIPVLLSNALDLTHLHKLEALKCTSKFIGACQDSLLMLTFPSALRKLTLLNFKVFPRVLTALSELPNLEMLDLNNCDFKREVERDEECETADEDEECKTADEECETADEDEECETADEDEEWESADEDEEWEAAEGDVFRSLQVLSLSCTSLKRWTADETNFPRLRHLRLTRCYKLEEIPSGIGEISTLESIELKACKDILVASAKEIVEVQSENGNYDLKLHISRGY